MAQAAGPAAARQGRTPDALADLSEKQRKFLDGYFRNEIYPILTPQAIDPGHPFPTISNTSLNFIIQLRSRDGVTRFARLKCPNNISRFVFIPRNKGG